jgi:hypothetical protein
MRVWKEVEHPHFRITLKEILSAVIVFKKSHKEGEQ